MIAAIVVAAGQGTRFGGNVPKQFLQLRDRPVLAYSLLSFENHRAVDQVVLVTAPEWKAQIEREIITRFNIRKVIAIVGGGKERQDSVAAGLQAISGSPELVAVHDAVRPFFSAQLLDRTIAGCQQAEACIPGLAPRDTAKQVEGQSVVRTLPRESLRLAQTPQIFRREALQRAFDYSRKHALQGTDEAVLIEASGGAVVWVEGEEHNLKITTRLDLQMAEVILADLIQKPEPPSRQVREENRKVHKRG